jgi:hypothetical protein
LLPFIEFFEEDFLWRYTPAKPFEQEILPATNPAQFKPPRLRPWLALMVLKNSEFTIIPATTSLPAKLVLNDASAVAPQVPAIMDNIMHPVTEHWAFGHVQASDPDLVQIGGTGATNAVQYADNFIANIANNPELGLCRLLSSRKLEANTSYTAFLIPAFESGRQAGLGASAQDLAAIPTLQASWYAPAGGAQVMEFPIYHQWYFGTAVNADFETLARRITPILPLGNTAQDVDVSQIGYGISAVPTAKEGIVESALIGKYVIDDSSPADTTATPVPTALETAIAGVINGTTLLGATANVTDYCTNKVLVFDDPVLTPPMFGKHQCMQDQVTAASPQWFQQLNLKPSNRMAASLGAQVVREHQDKFMERCWAQLGEVLAVNAKIASAQYAIAASKNLYNKHLIANTPNLPAAEKVSSILRTGSAICAKTLFGGTASETISYNMRVGALTQAPASLASTKLVKPRAKSVVIANRSTNDVMSLNLVNLDNASVIRSSPTSDARFTAIGGTSLVFGTPISTVCTTVNTTSTPPSVVSQMPTKAAGNIALYNRDQRWYFNQTYKFYQQIELANASNTNKLIDSTSKQTALAEKIGSNLEPEKALTGLVLQQLRYENGQNTTLFPVPLTTPPTPIKLQFIAAYPVIEDAMSKYLFALSENYLLPNIGTMANNTASAYEVNQRFIEAFMAGANDEFSRELLWRKYPTDQRGTTFRNFWSKVDSNAVTNFDIKPMHNWSSRLGANREPTSTPPELVLLIRSDLLRKYSNALIYAHQANNTSLVNAPIDRTLAPGSGSPSPIKWPLFTKIISPDIVAVAFDFTAADAKGTNGTNISNGWFFVLRERPGQLKFGLDITATSPSTIASWNDLDWGHMGPTQVIQISASSIQSITGISTANWDSDSANLAHILMQNPVNMAIHADRLLK